MPPRQLITAIDEEIDILEDEKFIYGNRLIGFLPCSDAFGVDLILDNYQKDLAKKQAEVAKKDLD